MASIKLNGLAGHTVEVSTGLFIDNQFVPAHDNSTIALENPSSGEHLATISAAQRQDVDKAVTSAKKALQTTWKDTPPAERAKLLNRLADIVERDADELATIEALDAGILFAVSKHGLVKNAVECLRYFAGWADKIDGHYLNTPGGMSYTRREPLGVCSAIIPWNTPLMIACWKLGPALAAGNTIIIKPSELAPLVTQKLAAQIREAGFPPGVVNVLCGPGPIAGAALAEHMEVRKIAFTGSIATGRGILKAAASSNLKKVTLELGGKGPSIVFADADLENALTWSMMAITLHNGQVCAAGSRIYVQASIYDRFLEVFRQRSLDAVHGDPLLGTTTKGPIISSNQHAKVMEYIQKGKESGAKLLYGSNRLGETGGHFVEDTAFANVTEDASIMKEEIFGPVASIAKFNTEDEAIAKANDTEYGLTASIFTENISRAHRVAAALECGSVMINCWSPPDANTPFGGVKQSGFGRDQGAESLDGWTSVKNVKILLLPDKESH